MNVKLQTTPTDWHDADDAPELTGEFFERADEYMGEKLVRRGRPPLANRKLSLTIRLDSDVVTAFKATGGGWQTRMNEALREWLKIHRTS